MLCRIEAQTAVDLVAGPPAVGYRPLTMYLPIGTKSRIAKRNKTARRNAKNKAKNRRRVNRMHKRALGRKLKRNG